MLELMLSLVFCFGLVFCLFVLVLVFNESEVIIPFYS